MLNRRHLLGALAVPVALTLASPAHAAGARPFNQAAFDAAQAAGKPILIDVSAPWCPTCKAQAPILSKLRAEPKYSQLVSFVIDFDSQKDLLKKFNVQRQSTLIVFKGKQEAGRSTGDTNAASIAALLAKSI
jgi:thiol-disulfide isomerase/thioredoxin